MGSASIAHSERSMVSERGAGIIAEIKHPIDTPRVIGIIAEWVVGESALLARRQFFDMLLRFKS